MSFFDNSHLVGLEGSAGPPVSRIDIFNQHIKQQFRNDSARALQAELRDRWITSLHGLDSNGGGKFEGPLDEQIYVAFAEHSEGKPISGSWSTTEGEGYGARLVPGDVTQNAYFQEMLRANEAIKKLNNPKVKSFEQILQEVYQMQREVEAETGEMYERGPTGSWLAALAGSVVGSFSTRDPLNIVSAPWGAGRTIGMRIASEMAIAAGVVATTELTEVAPHRELAGLPKHNPLYQIGAAALGAGVIRGGIEGVGVGLRKVREGRTVDPEGVDFDLRDSQLAQMFKANADKPSARAGLSILDDTKFIERNNPYGEGYQATSRFLAELQSVQRAMNGEPMTAVARVLPPIPYESLKKAADFEIVREQAPQIYAKMETAQAKVAASARLTISSDEGLRTVTAEGGVSLTEKGSIYGDELLVVYKGRDGKEIPINLKMNEGGKAEINIEPSYEGGSNSLGIKELRESIPLFKELYPDLTEVFGLRQTGAGPGRTQRLNLKAIRVIDNSEYEAAYRAVEAEAARINKQQIDAEAAQQRDAVNILASQGLPFIGPLLRRDSVAELVERINTFNDGLDERTAARFVRESVGEGEDKVEVEVWEKDGGIDIGLRDPVDPNFTFMTDEGEMTVAAAMRDLQDDTDLVEAIKGCAI